MRSILRLPPEGAVGVPWPERGAMEPSRFQTPLPTEEPAIQSARRVKTIPTASRPEAYWDVAEGVAAALIT